MRASIASSAIRLDSVSPDWIVSTPGSHSVHSGRIDRRLHERFDLQTRLNDLSKKRAERGTLADRLLWVWLVRVWHDWQTALVMVKPETVIAWHRRGFRLFWTWKSNQTSIGFSCAPSGTVPVSR
jgi:hypothetical protein